MEMTPELFPHTAQLLLLSTTETERGSTVFTPKKDLQCSHQIRNINRLTLHDEKSRTGAYTLCLDAL